MPTAVTTSASATTAMTSRLVSRVMESPWRARMRREDTTAGRALRGFPVRSQRLQLGSDTPSREEGTEADEHITPNLHQDRRGRGRGARPRPAAARHARAAARGVPGPAARVGRRARRSSGRGPQGLPAAPGLHQPRERLLEPAAAADVRRLPAPRRRRSTTACRSTCGARGPTTTRRVKKQLAGAGRLPGGRDRHHAQHHRVAGHGHPRHRPRARRRSGDVRPGLRDDAGAVPPAVAPARA